MNKTLWIKITAICGATAVVLGAFAAHGLASRLSEEMLQIFQTAVRYHFFHALALLGVVNLSLHQRTQQWAACSFLVGILLFSGSLYLLVLTDIRSLGMVTPIGGVAFIIGWILLFFSARTTSA